MEAFISYQTLISAFTAGIISILIAILTYATNSRQNRINQERLEVEIRKFEMEFNQKQIDANRSHALALARDEYECLKQLREAYIEIHTAIALKDLDKEIDSATAVTCIKAAQWVKSTFRPNSVIGGEIFHQIEKATDLLAKDQRVPAALSSALELNFHQLLGHQWKLWKSVLSESQKPDIQFLSPYKENHYVG